MGASVARVFTLTSLNVPLHSNKREKEKFVMFKLCEVIVTFIDPDSPVTSRVNKKIFLTHFESGRPVKLTKLVTLNQLLACT